MFGKRMLCAAVILSLIAGQTVVGLGAEAGAKAQKVIAYLKPDVSIDLYDQELVFRDVNGDRVYPVIYNGSTYLPVRAISMLMGEQIEWDAVSQTVFIGKTLNDPHKSGKPVDELDNDDGTKSASYADDKTKANPNAASSAIAVYLKPDVTIEYDFEIQTFKDVDGNGVYPIIYNGSTYLPVRAISGLMGEPIEWDAETKNVSIGDAEEKARRDAEKEAEKIKYVDSAATTLLKDFYANALGIYDAATTKISGLQSMKTEEELMLLAVSINEDVTNAQQVNADVKNIATDGFTDEETAAYVKLSEFTEMMEYYVLVMQNIAYMAAVGDDYSMFAETFYTFATSTMNLADETKRAVNSLPRIQVRED